MQIWYVLCNTVQTSPFSQWAVYVPHIFRCSCWTHEADSWQGQTRKFEENVFFCCFYIEKQSCCKIRQAQNKVNNFQKHRNETNTFAFFPSYLLHLWCLLPPPPLVHHVRHSTPQTLSKLAISGPPHNWGKTKKESHYYKDPFFLPLWYYFYLFTQCGDWGGALIWSKKLL